jgi:hypothetical protein
VAVGVDVVGASVAGVGVWVGEAVAMVDGVVMDGAAVDKTVAVGVTVLRTAVLQPQNTRSTQPS